LVFRNSFAIEKSTISLLAAKGEYPEEPFHDNQAEGGSILEHRAAQVHRGKHLRAKILYDAAGVRIRRWMLSRISKE
jgi:hypothetical protein